MLLEVWILEFEDFPPGRSRSKVPKLTVGPDSSRPPFRKSGAAGNYRGLPGPFGTVFIFCRVAGPDRTNPDETRLTLLQLQAGGFPEARAL